MTQDNRRIGNTYPFQHIRRISQVQYLLRRQLPLAKTLQVRDEIASYLCVRLSCRLPFFVLSSSFFVPYLVAVRNPSRRVGKRAYKLRFRFVPQTFRNLVKLYVCVDKILFLQRRRQRIIYRFHLLRKRTAFLRHRLGSRQLRAFEVEPRKHVVRIHPRGVFGFRAAYKLVGSPSLPALRRILQMRVRKLLNVRVAYSFQLQRLLLVGNRINHLPHTRRVESVARPHDGVYVANTHAVLLCISGQVLLAPNLRRVGQIGKAGKFVRRAAVDRTHPVGKFRRVGKPLLPLVYIERYVGVELRLISDATSKHFGRLVAEHQPLASLRRSSRNRIRRFAPESVRVELLAANVGVVNTRLLELPVRIFVPHKPAQNRNFANPRAELPLDELRGDAPAQHIPDGNLLRNRLVHNEVEERPFFRRYRRIVFDSLPQIRNVFSRNFRINHTARFVERIERRMRRRRKPATDRAEPRAERRRTCALRDGVRRKLPRNIVSRIYGRAHFQMRRRNRNAARRKFRRRPADCLFRSEPRRKPDTRFEKLALRRRQNETEQFAHAARNLPPSGCVFADVVEVLRADHIAVYLAERVVDRPFPYVVLAEPVRVAVGHASAHPAVYIGYRICGVDNHPAETPCGFAEPTVAPIAAVRLHTSGFLYKIVLRRVVVLQILFVEFQVGQYGRTLRLRNFRKLCALSVVELVERHGILGGFRVARRLVLVVLAVRPPNALNVGRLQLARLRRRRIVHIRRRERIPTRPLFGYVAHHNRILRVVRILGEQIVLERLEILIRHL